MKLSALLKYIEAAVREEWGGIEPLEESTGGERTLSSGVSSKVFELKKLYVKCAECNRCSLYSTAKNLVFGEGDPDTGFVVIGEAPGADEDEQGRPFVGRSGRLLRDTLAQAGLPPASVFIGNILKHRPPGNRNPLPAEIQACTPFLLSQLQIIRPKIIVTLGNFSSKFLLATETGITQLRGKTHRSPLGYTVFPTFHPSAVLRTPGEYGPVFRSDIAKAVEIFRGTD